MKGIVDLPNVLPSTSVRTAYYELGPDICDAKKVQKSIILEERTSHTVGRDFGRKRDHGNENREGLHAFSGRRGDLNLNIPRD